MGSITIKVPDDMERTVEEYAEESGRYMSTSELMRDAVRRLIDDHPVRLSQWAREQAEISEEQFERGESVSLDELE